MFAFLLLFGVLFCSNVAFKLEQSCSKFHYEEQTLEKMIRLQLFVEKIKEEVDSTQLKVMDELKALTKQREQLQTEIQEMKDDLERTKANMEVDKSKVKESTLVPPVAFQSHITKDSGMADNKVIVFSTNMLNYNGSYDNKTGTFTVPLDGIYMFSVQLFLPLRSLSYYGIYVNEAFVQHGIIGDANYYNTFTLVAVADVAKGDRVTVRCISSCGGDSLNENMHSSSSFSGVLIHRK